jgi:hypothetical protein
MHWLVNAAVRAGIPGAKTANLGSSMPLTAAWEQLARELRMPEGALAAALAPVLRIGLADVERVEAKAARLVPEKVARKHGVFALRESDRELTVASSDPQDYEAERDLGFASGRRIVFELAAPTTISDHLTGSYSADRIVENLLASSDSALADAVRVGKLDIADRMRPQDGRARIQVLNKSYDLRLSTVPTRDAEKAVRRGGVGPAARRGRLRARDHGSPDARHVGRRAGSDITQLRTDCHASGHRPHGCRRAGHGGRDHGRRRR